MYVKYREVESYANNDRRWLVLDISVKQMETEGDEQVVELPDLLWVPNRELHKVLSEWFEETIEIGNLGFPVAIYNFDIDEMFSDPEHPPTEFTDEGFCEDYIKREEKEWDTTSEILAWRAIGGEITVLYDDGEPYVATNHYVDNGIAFSNRVWIHSDYRGADSLYDHPVYEIAQHVLSRDDVDVTVAKVLPRMMDYYGALFDYYASEDKEFDYVEEENILWIAEDGEEVPASEIPFDWRDV